MRLRAGRAARVALCCAALAPALAAQDVEEPRTGERFARKTEGLALAGVGARTKLLVKVYAAGFYVDADAARRTLGRFRGMPAGELAGREDFYQRLVQADIGKALVMRFVYDAGAARVEEAFREGLQANLPGGLTHSAETFLAFFREGVGAKGSILTVRTEAGGRIVARSDGRQLGAVEDSPLSEALWKVWFGATPAIPKLKPELISLMPEILH